MFVTYARGPTVSLSGPEPDHNEGLVVGEGTACLEMHSIGSGAAWAKRSAVKCKFQVAVRGEIWKKRQQRIKSSRTLNVKPKV